MNGCVRDTCSPKIVLAFSGGLDTSYALVSLREQGWEVYTANIDTGGLVDGEEDAVRARADELGSAGWEVVRWKRRNLYFGGAAAVEMLSDGELRAAGDPRRGGAGVVVDG